MGNFPVNPGSIDTTSLTRPSSIFISPGSLIRAVQAQDVELVRQILETPDGLLLLEEVDPEDNDARTSLLVAASLGSLPIVKLLVEAGANLKAVTAKEGEGVVHRACASSNVEILEYLQSKSFDFDSFNESADATPLHYAAFNGQIGMMKFLIEKTGAQVDAPSSTGATPLFWGVKRGDGSVARYLISKGANVNMEDNIGRTPIFHAAASGTIDALKVLIEEGHANIHHRDKYGNTAFSIADSCDMWECTLYLHSVGCGGASAVRSRGYASAVRFSRNRLMGVPLPARSSGLASTCIDNGKLLLFGGYGLPLGQYYSNHYVKLESLPLEHIQTTKGNELFVIDFSHPKLSLLTPSDPNQRGVNLSDVGSAASIRRWNPRRCAPLLRLDSDGLTATYMSRDSFQPACVMADRAFQPTGTGYFEVTVLNKGINGFISIGLAREGYSLDQHPGWYATSYGYHGDDGRAFWSSGTGTPWGPRFTEGDTVGCGINFDSGEVFFTKNGVFLGVAHYRCPKKPFYPCVGLTSLGESLRANFGDSPFHFNFEAYMYSVSMPMKSQSLLPLSNPAMYNLDEMGKRVLLVGNALQWRAETTIFVIDTENWTSQRLTGQGMPDHPKNDATFDKLPASMVWPDNVGVMISTFDRAAGLLWAAYLCWTDHGRMLMVRKCNIETLVWTHVTDLKIPEETFDDSRDHYPLCLTFAGKFLFAWNALQDTSLYIRYTSDEPINGWETCPFQDMQMTHYCITALSNHQLMTSGGWDEFGQTNHVHLIDIVADEFSCQKLVWSKPRVSGVVPRPRNDHSVFRVSDSLYIAYGGWNGWNHMEDLDFLYIEEEKSPDSLEQLFDMPEYHDLDLVCSDGPTIRCNKVVLHARSSYFRELLSSTESSSLSIPLPHQFAWALIHYFYSDKFDAELIEPSLLPIFMDDIVPKYAPQCRSRIAQQIILARIHCASTFGKEMETYCWKNNKYTDIEFSIDDPSGPIHVRAHKAIICARSDFFRAMLRTGGLIESRQDVVEIKETSFEAFEALLHYIYCGSVDIEKIEPFVVDLLLASAKFAVSGLKSVLEGIISQSLTLDNVGALLLTADQIEATHLRQACWLFVKRNRPQLDQTPEFIELAAEIGQIMSTCKDVDLLDYAELVWETPSTGPRSPRSTNDG